LFIVLFFRCHCTLEHPTRFLHKILRIARNEKNISKQLAQELYAMPWILKNQADRIRMTDIAMADRLEGALNELDGLIIEALAG